MHETPLWLMLVVVLAAAELYSIGLMLLTRYSYGVSRLSLNNEVAGFKFAVVGVFYAVLLAFVVVAVWEEFRNTEAAVRDEAKAAIDLHRLTYALPTAGGSEIRENLLAYTDHVREREWPSMALGEPSEHVSADLAKLTESILKVEPQDRKQMALYQHALDLLMGMTDNRSERLDSATGSVPGVLWFVLMVGGLVTLGYPAFFGSSNLVAQVLMTAALAALVAFTLLLALAFDYPFSGVVRISPYPFDQALREMPPTWPPP